MNREQAVEIIERHIDNNIASGSLVEQALSMAIDALKAQLFSKGTTSDLISRQAAIDGKISIQRSNGVEIYSDEAVPVEYLKRLPTIQTVATDTNVRSNSEFPNNSDAVSRQAAIDLFPNDVLEWDTLNGYIAPHVARRLIEQLPPAQPEPQWIPVSERLPEDLEEVNVTWVNHNPESYYESIKNKPFAATAVYYKGKWYWWSTYTQDLLAEYGERCNVGLLHEAIEITAWMPLPSPYQKGATT